MIAYNHTIKFIPELDNNQKVDSPFTDTLTLKEASLISLPQALDFQMTFPRSQGRDLSLKSDRELGVTQKGQVWAFEVKGVITFFWHSGTMMISYIKHENFTEYLLKYWLLHVVLPVFFIIEGIYSFLHAGAVEVKSKPVLFIAPSMGGKSTMTDYFMQQGHTMISDDKVATFQKEGYFYAVPSYAYHRPYRNVEDMGKFVHNFAEIPKQIDIIYALEKVAADREVTIQEVSGIEKLLTLRNAKEMNLFFPESMQLEYLGEIAKTISLYRVDVPWDLTSLDEVYQTIIKHHSNIEEK